MAGKITELTSHIVLSGVDLLYVVDDPLGDPVSKKMSVNTFFGGIPANTIIDATLTVTGNTTLNGGNTTINSNTNIFANLRASGMEVANNKIVLTKEWTPANSTVVASQGTIGYDDNYIYIAIANNNIKRAALSSF